METPNARSAAGLLQWPEGNEIPEGFTIAFSTRMVPGGKDARPANYGFSGNVPGAVEARKRICEALDLPFERLTFGEQVHGVNVESVRGGRAGAGRNDPASRLPGTDALITGEPGTPLAVLTADCLPVLLAAPGKGAGAAHAGWRGLLSGILGETVRKMRDELGADPADVLAFLGPSIGPCCFEVGEDVYGKLDGRFADCAVEKEGAVFVDLWKAGKRKLEMAGLKPEKIYCAGVCTRCGTDLFFSYRGDKRLTGSNISIIARRV